MAALVWPERRHGSPTNEILIDKASVLTEHLVQVEAARCLITPDATGRPGQPGGSTALGEPV